MTPQDIHPLHQLIISVSLGLLVGLQRQWADPRLGGIRTFSLVSVFGTLCGFLAEKSGPWVIVVGMLSVAMVILIGNLQNAGDPSVGRIMGRGNEIAMLLMFVIGVIVRTGPIWLAASAAGTVAVILQAKIELHGLIKKFSDKDVKAIMQFVLLSLVILPVVPNEAFGPFHVLNPHEIWMMVLLIVAISLTGYIIFRIFGSSTGVLINGLLGGLISSTATTVSYAKKSGEAVGSLCEIAVVIAISWTIVYLRMMIEVLAAGPNFTEAYFPMAVLFTGSALSTAWIWRRSCANSPVTPDYDNPTELRLALMFGVVYAAIILASAAARHYLGSKGIVAVSLISGIGDVDAVNLSAARLVQSGNLPATEAWRYPVIAIMANLVFRGMLARVLSGPALFRRLMPPWIVSLILGGALLIIWR